MIQTGLCGRSEVSSCPWELAQGRKEERGNPIIKEATFSRSPTVQCSAVWRMAEPLYTQTDAEGRVFRGTQPHRRRIVDKVGESYTP